RALIRATENGRLPNRQTSSARTPQQPTFDVERVAMEEIFPPDANPNEEISIERCRELLGDEAGDLLDDEIDQIRLCADTIARALIEMFIDEKRPAIH